MERTSADAHKSAQTSTRSARELRRADWDRAFFLLSVEGLSYAQTARLLNVKPGAIRMRAAREEWFSGGGGTPDQTMDGILADQGDRQMMRVMIAMTEALDAAAGETDPARLALALKKSELIGRFARCAQSIARARNVLASTGQTAAQAGVRRRDAEPPARANIPSVEDTIRILEAREALARAQAAAKQAGET